MRRKTIRRRWALGVGGGLLLVLLATGGWIGIHALQAKAELESAQALVGTLQSQALEFDIDSATATFAEVSEHTSSARALTDDFIWRTGELIPYAGGNLRAVRELAAATDDIIVDVVGPLIGVASTLDPDALAPKDGAINLQPVMDAMPAISSANTAAQRASADVGAIEVDGTLSQVADAHAKIDGMLSQVAPLLDTLDSVLPLALTGLGTEGPRTYVLMFQNTAEVRPLGGAALTFALLSMDQGRIQLVGTESATFSGFPFPQQSMVPIPDGAEAVYPGGMYGTFIANATLRPSFTTAAEITQANWLHRFGYTVDGIISIDPRALSYVLRATDPIKLSNGEVLNSDSLVEILLNKTYLQFNTGKTLVDNASVDVIFDEAISSTFSALTSGAVKVDLLVEAIMQSWNENRLLLWSAHEDEQAVLAELGLKGEIPVSDAETERVGLYFQDGVGAKLNYYLRQKVALSQGTCRDDGRQNYRISADLSNVLDPAQADSLPFAIVGTWLREGLQPGVQKLIVLLYAPEGSEITSARINGEAVALQPLHDTIHPVGKVVISIPPGQTVNLTYDFVSADSGEKEFEAQLTPLVTATEFSDVPLDCATVAVP